MADPFNELYTDKYEYLMNYTAFGPPEFSRISRISEISRLWES